MDEAYVFLTGASALASGAIGLFFLRFWRRSHDRLFAFFALAFGVFAANRVILVIVDDNSENETWVYLIRLAAFVLILAAIIDRNKRDTA